MSASTKFWPRTLLPAAAALALASGSLGMFAMPTDMPVGRVISNVTKYTREHPEDAAGFYTLGRAHALAYTLKIRTISVWEHRPKTPGLIEIAADYSQSASWRDKGGDPPPTREELLVHLKAGIESLAKAVGMETPPPERHLSYAYLLDAGAEDALDAGVLPPPAGPAAKPEQAKDIEALIVTLASDKASERDDAKTKLRAQIDLAAPILFQHRADANKNAQAAIKELLTAYWRERALAQSFQAYKGGIATALKIKEQPLGGLRIYVGYEAAKMYVRLMTSRGPRTEKERDDLAAVTKDVKTLENLPPCGAITPIVFAIDRPAPLSDLLSGATTCFDLDGDGRVESWPWVRPSTGILVWDPSGSGSITSGRQLFGSATWWMFFADGYRALDALDDDRDGWLIGDELKGLSLWFDVNGNGVSEPGEVLPVERVGIRGIATRSTSSEAQSPANHDGVLMSDGRVLPSYDWVVSPTPAGAVPPCDPAPMRSEGTAAHP